MATAPAPEDRALEVAPTRANDYDSFAEAYAASNETAIWNAYYERPAMLALAGNVTGRRILDAGCGSGPLSAELRDRGAAVTGIDASVPPLVKSKLRKTRDINQRQLRLRPGPLQREGGRGGGGWVGGQGGGRWLSASVT